jgi:hypothetical protein
VKDVFEVSELKASQPDLVLEAFSDINEWKTWSAHNRWIFDRKRIVPQWVV